MNSTRPNPVEKFMRRHGSNDAPCVFDTPRKIDDLEVFTTLAYDFGMHTVFHIDEDLLGDMGVNWGGGRWIKVSIHRPSETDVMDEEVVSDELILITDRYKDYFCETFSDWELDLNPSKDD